MGNLIRAEFYRLRRRPHSVLGMALILLLGVSLLTVSCALPPQVGSAATLLQSISTLSVSGMFFAVWCAAAASSGVNKLDILKHEAVFGIPRWQIYLSRLATACLLGVGLGKGRQKFLYLPEEHNDCIFAVICEELGLVGACVIMLVFALLILRGFWIALHARDRFGALLVVGFMTLTGLQTFLNIAVVTGLVPATGISLPFFSYGGTALLCQLAEMGIVLSVSRQMPAPENG